MKNPEQSWVLWDGDCGFCRHSVDWVKARDRDNRLFAMPYQQAPSPPMTPMLNAACSKAVHVVTPDGTVLRAGRAMLYLLDQIGWGLLVKPLMLPPFIWGVELFYRIVAANRMFFSRLFFPRAGNAAVCSIPPHSSTDD
jgi:predicted DCC family thiol-disulfide oxidoreductase YuxK